MNPSIKPLNITAAALITQFLLIIIMFVGAMILRGTPGLPFWKERRSIDASHFAWIILLLAIVTIGCLIFSVEFIDIWSPLFPGVQFPSIMSQTALSVMFVLDIFCVAYLVVSTGGSQLSVFTPIFFILPALAIFLRQPYSQILIHVGLVVSMFMCTLRSKHFYIDENRSPMLTVAYIFISIACFCLTTFIAYITRPF